MFNFCFLRIQELWSEFLLNQIRTPWILRFFCVFLSPFVSFLWLHQRLQIGYGKFFRQNTTPCGVEIFPKTLVAWTFHSNLRVYLCHGNVSNGRTEIPAKVHGSDCNQVACPSSWQCLRKREFWMSKSEYKNGILKKNTPNDEQRKAGTARPWSKCVSEGTDKCLSSARHFRRTLVGIANQQTTLYASPFDRGRRERHGMLYAWMLFHQFLLNLIADSRHWGVPF